MGILVARAGPDSLHRRQGSVIKFEFHLRESGGGTCSKPVSISSGKKDEPAKCPSFPSVIYLSMATVSSCASTSTSHLKMDASWTTRAFEKHCHRSSTLCGTERD